MGMVNISVIPVVNKTMYIFNTITMFYSIPGMELYKRKSTAIDYFIYYHWTSDDTHVLYESTYFKWPIRLSGIFYILPIGFFMRGGILLIIIYPLQGKRLY